MQPVKPSKTAADWLVIALSPALIMLLVGSLCFFLIEVFYRGQAEGSVRWVMFWFVLAVVLVTRIGIEQGAGLAAGYGIALALATWFYLVRIHPAYLLGAVLLGVVWWCAHKLTRDCTLLDDSEDASGGGLLQTIYQRKGFKLLGKKTVTPSVGANAAPAAPVAPAAPHAPGRWVVWFSVAALPLFGVGQMLLPPGDAAARSAGLAYLFIYVAAGLGLLLTTSFLGLRRYLRQRYLTMPGRMAFGWIRFGATVAVLVLLAALLLPRPGALVAWQQLAYHVDYQLHQASEYAARFSPHGLGAGKPGQDVDKSAPPANLIEASGTQKTPGPGPEKAPDPAAANPDNPPPPVPPEFVNHLYQWFRLLLLLGLAGLLAAWAYRNREVLRDMARTILAAIRKFFADLYRWGSPSVDAAAPAVGLAKAKSPHFAAFQNPFLTGNDTTWTAEQLVLYSFEALQVWAGERGMAARPEQTAREFCAELGRKFPEITTELGGLAILYGRAAYGGSVPAGMDLESVKKVWRYLAG